MLNQSAMAAAAEDVFDDDARKVIAKLLRVDVARLTPDASLTADLKVDSLDFLALVVGLERHFDIDLPDAEAAEVRKVSEMIELLRVHQRGSNETIEGISSRRAS